MKEIISQISLIGIVSLIILTDYLNPIKEYLPLLWTFIIIIGIFHRIKYRKGNVTKELRFLTKNDDYNKTYPFIIGTLLLIGGVCALNLMDEFIIFSSLMTLNGILLIITGFLFIPNGVIWIKKNKLISINGNQKNNIKIETLIEMKLYPDSIIFIDQAQNKYKIEYLNLKLSDFHQISDFISKRLNKEIERKTSGNIAFTK